MLSQSHAGYDAAGLLTIRDVANRLSVSLATVRRLIEAGELPRVRVGGSVRFETLDVEALIARGKRMTEATRLVDKTDRGSGHRDLDGAGP